MRTVFRTLMTLVLLGGPHFSGPLRASPEADAMLARFAPVFVQGCHGRADYITRFDYDGNWNGEDNWENLDRGAHLPAVLYTSAIATPTHWYLTYSAFHPRDWWPLTSVPGINHENDLEGILVVLEKRSAGTPELLAVETISHSSIKRYSTHPALKDDRLDGGFKCEGEHPILEAEAYKHGIHAWEGADLAHGSHIVYRYTGVAEEPKADHGACGYAFVSLHESFWAHRNEVGPGKMYGEALTYRQGTFGARLNGDNYGKNKANAPWNWADSADHGLARGDWFFNPARAMRVHYPKAAARFALTYTENAYLLDGMSGRDATHVQLFSQLGAD